MNIVLRILGIILIVLSLLLLIAVPPAGVIGILLGALCIIRSNKKLTDKITANLAKSREKAEQSYDTLKNKIDVQQLKLETTIMYSEREIPDNSEEAKQILAKREKYKNETTAQMLKRLSNKQRNRMEAAGLKLYVWSTCGDERVCDACKIMDEKLCRWESPYVFSEDGGKTWKRRPEGAAMAHPGQHKGCKDHCGCRCTSLAYEPEITGEM